MATHVERDCGPRKKERGFALLDSIVALAVSTAFVLATATAFGLRAPRTHPAALTLQAALVEARSLALTTADDTDAAHPTGATVLVAPDAQRAGGSVVTIFRSRPIAAFVSGGVTAPLVPDLGLPPQRVAAQFRIGTRPLGAPFAILISSSGYASIAIPYVYASGANPLATDPGCADAGVTIVVNDGSATESHPFDCRDGTYAASTPG